jgi:MoaA/NifB/PqqE/SkfB family radical SAM enzyme
MDKKCVLPWIHLHTFPNNTVYPCCLTPQNQPVGSLDNNTLKEVFNSEGMRNIRKDMLAGKEPSSCNRCFEQERAGQYSMRNDVNKRFAHHTSLIETTQIDGTVDDMNLVYWDFRFSNICNFKCRSCGPQLSSGWYDDFKKLSGGKLPADCPDPDRPLVLWEQLLPLFDSVEEIYFAGGEPLIMEEHYRILNRLIELGKTDVQLRYNTNFSRMKYKQQDVIELWQHFPNVKIDCSIDGMNSQGEYVRKGMQWQQVLDNRQRLKQLAPHVWFGVSCTTSIQNAYHVVDFWHWCYSSGFIEDSGRFHVNLVQDPIWLRLCSLPQHHKLALTRLYTDAAETALEHGFTHTNADWMAAANFMNSGQEDNLELFRYRMKLIDDLREENFADTFPELGDLMCE